MTSVVIADDQDLVRDGICLMLETRGLDVLATAVDGRAACDAVTMHDPDVVLMDIRMPGLDGIAATRELVESQSRTRVLVLTTYDLDEYVYEALRAGAAGFLLKTTPPDRLVAGIECVAAGDALLAPTVTRRLIAQHVAAPRVASGPSSLLAALTDREREVLVLIAGGLSNDDIAQRLVVSGATVKTHVNRILAKLHLTSRVQAVVLAYETGVVQPARPVGSRIHDEPHPTRG